MTTSKDNSTRRWRMATYGGVIVTVLLMITGSTSLVSSIIAGLAVFAIVGLLLPRFAQAQSPDTPPAKAPEPSVAQTAAPAPKPEPVKAPEPVVAPEPVASVAEPDDTPPDSGLVKPSKALPGQQELAARKGTWRFENKSRTA